MTKTQETKTVLFGYMYIFIGWEAHGMQEHVCIVLHIFAFLVVGLAGCGAMSK